MKRASGTFWERQLAAHGPIYVVLLIFAGGMSGAWLTSAIVLVIFPFSVMAVIDLFTYTRFNLQSVHVGTQLRIGEALIAPNEVISIREVHLSATKNGWDFVEIHYRANGFNVHALTPSRPTWIWQSENQTMAVIFRGFPKLRSRVKPSLSTHDMEEIRDPSIRKPDPTSDADSPHVYRKFHPNDPYFTK